MHGCDGNRRPAKATYNYSLISPRHIKLIIAFNSSVPFDKDVLTSSRWHGENVANGSVKAVAGCVKTHSGMFMWFGRACLWFMLK